MSPLNAFKQCILVVMFFTLASPMQMWGGYQSWVGPTGNDSEFCNPAGPCASFQGAFYSVILFNATPTVEVTALNSGSYGGGGLVLNAGENVAKLFTVDGGEGNVSCITAQNIIIGQTGGENTTYGSGSIVTLRNLTMYGENFSGPAIQLGPNSNGLTLIIEGCKIYGYTPGSGIGVIDCQNEANVIIKDTIIEGNNGNAIMLSTGGTASLSKVAIKNNSGIALYVSDGTTVDISDSVITLNTGPALISSGESSVINCVNNIVTSNLAAIGVESSGLVRISNNDIYNNDLFIDYIDETGEVITANNNRTGGNGVSPAPPTGSITIQ
ncbi:MAG: right-handed parallel beta-helix repeat-containing protein [Parachlamydiaceae bacterium]